MKFLEKLPGKCLIQLLFRHNQCVSQLATQLVDCGKVVEGGGYLGALQKKGDCFWIILLPQQLLQPLLGERKGVDSFKVVEKCQCLLPSSPSRQDTK